ncbi:TetR family transcriptional regulator [Actinoplanes ianthinogenes]|uniref:TetR family transcriptional regulator n=1 Tax=Actinoplanes ianthinogenes TaxID=122358 RepID=A0ABM7LSG5_9ACTN|nr:TetR/AcrR family transcriptional regulator [Actinoplanes ianthinogenes]BCJ42222.1 TetR family transcriptional regulator [Actinoplanes ianthinogenes]GGR55209.1 TetR family transcriptional regulator [Actinoplanes ianthinogenes]
MSDTKQRLLDGALDALRDHGVTGTSARTIAAAAGVNQALVFYHYGSVDELVGAACRQATEQRVAHYSDRFAAVTSLRELLQVGRELHASELAQGNVSVLAQTLAAAQSNARLAEPIRATFQLWTTEIEAVLRRVLAGSPIAEVADVPGLAQAISSAFVGLELFEGIDPDGGRRAMEAIDQLAVLVEVMDELGPLATRVLRSRIKKAGKR